MFSSSMTYLLALRRLLGSFQNYNQYKVTNRAEVIPQIQGIMAHITLVEVGFKFGSGHLRSREQLREKGKDLVSLSSTKCSYSKAISPVRNEVRSASGRMKCVHIEYPPSTWDFCENGYLLG